MVESIVAIGIFSIVMLLLAGVLAGGLRGVHLSRQRTAATADANQVLETARSLAFVDVGLVSSDSTIATDPRISGTCPASCLYDGETLVFSQTTVNHPLNPHTQLIDRSPTTLTRSIYVTGSDTNGDGQYDLKRVTVVVSWDRAAVNGVDSSVTATTLVSPNSPGTLGNPPLGSPPPGQTNTFPPLYGTARAGTGSLLVEAELGAGADLDSVSGPATQTLRIGAVSGHGDDLLNANTTTSCTQQFAVLEGLSSTPGSSATAAADSVTNPGPNTDSESQSQTTSGIVTPPLSLSTGTLTGTASCTAEAPQTGPALASESGSSSLASLQSEVTTSGYGLTSLVGSLAPAELGSYAASQSVSQSVPADKQMNVSATHTLGDLKLLRQIGLGGDVIDLGMPEGVVHVASYSATADAAASATTGARGVSADPAKPLTVKIWNNGVASNLHDGSGSTVSCNSQSANYCILTPSLDSQLTVTGSISLCVGVVGCTQAVTVDVFVQVNPASLQTLTLADGLTRIYRAYYSPVQAQARIRIGNISEGTLIDLRTSGDMGSILSCAKYGVYPGGCA